MRTFSLAALVLGLQACSAFLVGPAAAPSSSAAVRARRATTSMAAAEQPDGMDRRAALGQAASLLSGLGALSLLPSMAAAKGVKRIKNAPVVTLDTGVQYQDMAVGSGPSPKLGDRVAVHYSLYYNGLEVESSRDSSGLAARPFGFNWGTQTGTGAICKGVQQGMEGMMVGSRRKITVPPELAFGKKGLPPFIPPDATVLFDVSIWSIKPAGTNPNLTLPGQQNYF